ncbi:phage antirepressor KilAC domain-containing protein [Pseudomonas sp. NPDC089741]|uniref:phage antirepressor KilAC domain-containing protein n=1 Tax=Pseudomonas sp. NPDC089741 TaxID=3364470 RepID=UPI003823F02A
MFESTTYNHATTRPKNKAIRIDGRGLSLEREMIPPLDQQASVLTMSSLEFSVLTETPHEEVLMDICEMLDDQGLDASDYLEAFEIEDNNNLSFSLPKEEVFTLLDWYSISVQAKVIDRWHELEAQTKKPVYTTPTSLTEALKLAATLECKRLALVDSVRTLEERLSGVAEKVNFYDDIADTGELFNTAVVAKTLGTGKMRFFNFLRKHKVLLGTGNKRNLPYQQHLDAGRLKVKWITGTDRQTGERYIKPVPLFTGEGIIWIHQFVEQKGRLGL